MPLLVIYVVVYSGGGVAVDDIGVFGYEYASGLPFCLAVYAE